MRFRNRNNEIPELSEFKSILCLVRKKFQSNIKNLLYSSDNETFSVKMSHVLFSNQTWYHTDGVDGPTSQRTSTVIAL